MKKSYKNLGKKNNLATKKDLKQTEDRLNNRIDRVIKVLEYRIKPLEEFVEEMRQFKNKILDRMDWLIGKFEKFEQEFTAQNEQNRRVLDRIENHEIRISKLEKSSSLN